MTRLLDRAKSLEVGGRSGGWGDTADDVRRAADALVAAEGLLREIDERGWVSHIGWKHFAVPIDVANALRAYLCGREKG